MFYFILFAICYFLLLYMSNRNGYKLGYRDGRIQGIDDASNILKQVIKEANSCTTVESKNTISQTEKEYE